MGQRIQRIKTPVSESQMAEALISAWQSLFNKTPNKQQISMLLAQNDLETAHRQAMWNYNVGNITTDGSHDYFDDLTTNEQTSPGNWQKMNLKYRAYPSLIEGAKDYLKLLSSKHYGDAWEHIVNPNPVGFSQSLKEAGYYTANEAPYTKALVNLYNQNNKSNNYELAMSGNKHQPAETFENTLDEIFNQFMSLFANKYDHNILIKIGAPDYTDAIEFSRILSSALDEELLSKSYVFSDGYNIEVECFISGPMIECYGAVIQLTESMVEAFKEATNKIGMIDIKADCLMNKRSCYQPLSLKTSLSQYRQFLLKWI